jgi:signal transduction histidine kinase
VANVAPSSPLAEFPLRPDKTAFPAKLWRVCKWAIALLFSAIILLTTLVPHGSPKGLALVAVGGLEVLGLLLLLWRPKGPVAVALGEAVIVLLILAIHPTSHNAAFTLELAAIFSLVMRRPTRQALTVAFAAWLAVALALVVAGGGVFAQPLSDFALAAAATAMALYFRSQRALVAAAQERAAQAERLRERDAAHAVAEERARIARELHDVVAHHVSLLVVQAGAVRETVGPEHPSREVLDSMIAGGRQAMTELRAMLGALRSPDVAPPVDTGTVPVRSEALTVPLGVSAPRSPLPSLADVNVLVDGARAAGLPVTLHLAGDLARPSPAVALAAYRITQEALTNVVKHAPGADTTVAIECRPDGVSLHVQNGKGLLPVTTVPGQQGHGLTGMRERAALCRGHVQAWPAGEGFAVEAWLPTQ